MAMTALLLLLACARPSPPEDPMPLSSEHAAALAGHPGAEVVRVVPLAHLPDLVEVTLQGDDLPHPTMFLLALDGTDLVTARGEAAAAAFLRRAGADALAGADIEEVELVLEHFGAWPAGFDRNSASFEKRGVGRSSYRGRPFELVLFARADDDPFGGVTAPIWRRATLTAGADLAFTWTFDRWEQGSWLQVDQRPVPEAP